MRGVKKKPYAYWAWSITNVMSLVLAKYAGISQFKEGIYKDVQLISEIFPNNVRANGQSFGTGIHWIFAALITLAGPLVIDIFADIDTRQYAYAFQQVTSLLQNFGPQDKASTFLLE